MESPHSPAVFALVDCNNFFVSCERIFRPELDGKPVVVLSSNDGCVVARSNEAKALGIPMGAPAFQYRRLFNDYRVICFSANFELYADISRRIITILTAVTPHLEIYSIDESFLQLHELAVTNYGAWGRALRAHILQSVGVPVSVGIAPTKTLAKLGADMAKKDPAYEGVLDLAHLSPGDLQACLAAFPLEAIWGIGRRLAPKLRVEGLASARDVAHLRPARARQLMGLPGLHTVLELQGINCHGTSTVGTAHKTIMRGRTFGEDTNGIGTLEAAVATLTARAVSEARREQQLVRRVELWLSTSRHKPGYQAWREEILLPAPTADTGAILRELISRLQQIYLPHCAYHRASVTLTELTPAGTLQLDIFHSVHVGNHEGAQSRMTAVDTINSHFGRGTIYFAAEKLDKTWEPKHQLRSPRYVSNWDELPEAYSV